MAAPLMLLGVIGLSIALATLLWIPWADHVVGAQAWFTLVLATAFGATGLVAARGCRVVIRDGIVCDQVAWRTVHRTPQAELAAVRVRRGIWRVFEMELADGRRRVVLGIGPQQFPSTISEQARERDMAMIEALMGPEPDEEPG